tara:strand:+ start:174 stop:467 length:294 start_codon:yes stop_codon:yes gene_type:complete
MKINFFKLKRNKRYNYTPRYYKGKEEEGSFSYSLDSRFIKYRKVFNKNDFGQKWSDERKKMRVFSNRFFSFRLALIILILTLIFLYVIDFDIKIFKF